MSGPRRGAAQAARAAEQRREEDRSRVGEPAADSPRSPAATPGEDEAEEQLEEPLAAADEGDVEAAELEEPLAAADEGDVEAEPEDPLVVAERERDRYLALAQRTQADFENFRKRAAKDIAAAGGRARASMARALLPAVDNLERAIAAAGDGEDGLLHGVRLVHSELIQALERNGVESFEPAGEVFDPTVHEAISTRPEDGAEAGVVLDVVEKGYRLDGTVLRPARVVVAA